MSIFSREKAWVGIDIGTHTTKMVKLSVSKKGVRIRGYDEMPTPLGAVKDRDIAQTDVVGMVVKDLVHEHRLKKCRVVTSIGGENVVMRLTTFPKMSQDELQEIVKWEADRYVPISGPDAAVEYYLADDDTDDNHMSVLLAGTYRSLINRHLSVMQTAGLRPEAIEPEQLALTRLVGASSSQNEVNVIVDLGQCDTRVIVASEGLTRLARVVSPGQTELIEHISADTGIETDEVNRLVTKCGLDRPSDIITSLQDVMGRLVLEIGRSLEFFFSQNRTVTISRIILVGGGADMPGIASYLDEMLSTVGPGGEQSALPAPEVFHFARRGAREKFITLRPRFAVAVGLALRGVWLS